MGTRMNIRPYDSREYQLFVEQMAQHCRCTPLSDRPCAGVLAGGLCDDMHWDPEHTDQDDDACEPDFDL